MSHWLLILLLVLSRLQHACKLQSQRQTVCTSQRSSSPSYADDLGSFYSRDELECNSVHLLSVFFDFTNSKIQIHYNVSPDPATDADLHTFMANPELFTVENGHIAALKGEAFLDSFGES